ncbi:MULTISPECIES: DUF3368 domain-containing protein [Thioalkalivibrio]|uniref:DNA-binding protein n=1 Tax=Thioalkalivibrio halophilus TaxID=252474 RepID=A0A1V3A152_9GAMM|nr:MULTISPECIES: DUF3368 domain-containing protein [Thioalkalivibrio]OOC11097.1 DNA-binding protein [Thioalkalivibrio halophilus]
MARLVLSDASPLIGLSFVDGLEWLPRLFGTVGIPEEVAREVLPGQERPGESAIAAALDAGWLCLREGPRSSIPLPELDEGEAACIRMALGHDEPALVLMDERMGRALALEAGIRVAGTAAVIGMARRQGLIPSARAVFERLHQSEFRIAADVIRTVLDRVGESEGEQGRGAGR